MKVAIVTRAAILVIVIAIAGSTPLRAQYYWDANGSAGGYGGTGVWNIVDQTWRNGHPNNPLTAWVNNNNVLFGGTPCADCMLTLETNIVVNTLNWYVRFTFNGPYTLALGSAARSGGTAGGTINCPMILKDSNRHYRNALTINGNISDDGGARNLSHHFETFTLNGSNSFGGGVTLQSGELSIGNDFALGTGAVLSVYNGAILEAGRGDRTIRTTKLVQDWCTLLIARGTNNLTFAASQDLKGAFDLVYPDGPRYRVVETNGVLTFGGLMRSGTIHKAGMTKEGPGTFVIDGPYYCALKTVVADGTLILNGTTTLPNNNSGYSVMAGATLGGTGVVNLAASGSTCTVQRAGALAPGTHRGDARVGKLTINGPVSLAEGARFKWDCRNGVGDLLDVNGRLNLPAMATVVVSRISGELPEAAPIMTANSLAGSGAGDVGGWVVQGERGVRLKVADNAVMIERFQPGTLFLVR